MTSATAVTRPKVIFILGVGHCGSTLLDLILGSHSSAFSLGELRAIPDDFAVDRDRRVNCGVCGTDCRFWNQRARLNVLHRYFSGARSRNPLSQRIYWHIGPYRTNLYRHLLDWSQSNLVVDSSKMVVWMKRQLRPAWHWRTIEPWLLYIHRDGRAVVNSYLRKYTNLSAADATTRWVRETQRIERFYAQYDSLRKLSVAYEELACSPDRVVQRICESLALPYEASMLDFWQHEHHLVNGNAGTRALLTATAANPTQIRLDLRWRTELPPDSLRTFEELAGHVNKPYVYQD
jgi:hypothetical protein